MHSDERVGGSGGRSEAQSQYRRAVVHNADAAPVGVGGQYGDAGAATLHAGGGGGPERNGSWDGVAGIVTDLDLGSDHYIAVKDDISGGRVDNIAFAISQLDNLEGLTPRDAYCLSDGMSV